ncbi:hypothetical protein M153_68050001027 [Pseudoloma neurophilia]|uniref:Uncharacterized protein n=1 Tax=Pseudoloma neurophilia TaxID=146866 RepID=A0A0R0M057_9MICR|nr:hypothetical protein M153_68050001027 [Pseudoloma neurophilia]
MLKFFYFLMFVLTDDSPNNLDVILSIGSIPLTSDGTIFVKNGIFNTFTLNTLNTTTLYGDILLNGKKLKLVGNEMKFDKNRHNHYNFIYGKRENCNKIFLDNICVTEINQEIALKHCKITKSQCIHMTIVDELPDMITEKVIYNSDTRVDATHRAMDENDQISTLSGSTKMSKSGLSDPNNDKQFENMRNKSDQNGLKHYSTEKNNPESKYLVVRPSGNEQTKSFTNEENDRLENNQSLIDEQEEQNEPYRDPHAFSEENSVFGKEYDLSKIQPSIDEAFHEVIAKKTDIPLNQKRYIPSCFYGYQAMQQFLKDPLPNYRKMRRKYCYDTVYDISQ